MFCRKRPGFTHRLLAFTFDGLSRLLFPTLVVRWACHVDITHGELAPQLSVSVWLRFFGVGRLIGPMTLYKLEKGG